jgi:RimJ/RimL family protein N-acetyltransferase
MQDEWQIGRAAPSDWEQVAALWLGGAAHQEQIIAFQKTLAADTESAAEWWIAHGADQIDAVMLILPQAGKMATCWAPRFALGLPKEKALRVAQQLWNQAKQKLQENGTHIFQALTADSHDWEAEILRNLGFAYITQLLIMRWSARIGMPPMSGNQQTSLVPVKDDNEDLFRQTVALSQADSLDAPELDQYQTTENSSIGYADVHHQRWLISDENHQAIGGLVLSQEGTLGQLIYCGLVPQFRRQRMGTFAVQWALQFFRAQYVRRVSVRLDARNLPARQLYERCGFKVHETEELFLSN